MFTIEFFRIRERDNAHATLGRITHIASDLERKGESQVAFRHVELTPEPRWLAYFGPGRARGVLLDAGDWRLLKAGRVWRELNGDHSEVLFS